MYNWNHQEILSCLSGKDPFPLGNVLKDSLFYPASGIDGSPIRHAKVLGVNSFVYVDTFTTENEFDHLLNSNLLRGYHLFGQRRLNVADLIPLGWSLKLPQGTDEHLKNSYLQSMKRAQANPNTAFARWSVFERNEGLDDNHGPSCLSLLFLRAEGAAAYQALYIEQNIVPKILAIIRPGTGLGGNFTMFEEFLYLVMKMHPLGLPSQLLAWHSADQENNLLDPIFQGLYTEKILGPLSKDNESQNALSLFLLKNS
jgi:hypothetical protein